MADSTPSHTDEPTASQSRSRDLNRETALQHHSPTSLSRPRSISSSTSGSTTPDVSGQDPEKDLEKLQSLSGDGVDRRDGIERRGVLERTTTRQTTMSTTSRAESLMSRVRSR